MVRTTRTWAPVAMTLAAIVTPSGMSAQDSRGEQFYYPGSFNWSFLETSPEAARLFNAFDYGHAVLSEVLWTEPDAADASARLDEEYVFLTTDLLRQPPRFAVAEEAVAPSYVRSVWRAHAMFHWAHVLHRQLYDVYADEGLSDGEKQSLGERITDYYLSSPFAFTAVPKSMALMDDQYYSQSFRAGHARFNGLIWAYHWLQVGLYEPLIAAGASERGRAMVDEAVARFFGMVDGGASFPSVMPMTPTVAPTFTMRHPRAAAIFDNLHMMHDIISDILVSPRVPRDRKRDVIYEALDEFQDPTRNVMSTEAWHAMGEHMGGLAAMGGPPMGPPAPENEEAGHGQMAPGDGMPDHGGHHE